MASIAGENVAETMRTVQASADAYSRAHAANAAEYINVTTQMMRAGQQHAAAIQTTAVAMRLATATTSEAKGAATSLNVLYEAAGNKTADLGTEYNRLADILTRTKQVYGDAFNVGELADPLKDATAAARDAKVPIEQIVGTLGALGAAGILGGEGGMGVNNVITGLLGGCQTTRSRTGAYGERWPRFWSSPSRRSRPSTGDIKQASPETLAAMQTAFGSTWREVSLLLTQTDKLSKQWGSIGDSAGAAAAAQAASEATMTGQLAQLDAQLNSVKVTLGVSIMGAAARTRSRTTEVREAVGGVRGSTPATHGHCGDRQPC